MKALPMYPEYSVTYVPVRSASYNSAGIAENFINKIEPLHTMVPLQNVQK
jgi:hypothetical protein